MSRNKYAFIVDGLIKGMNRGVHPVQYLRLADYDDPLIVLRSVSKILESRHAEIDQSAYNLASYCVLLKAGLLMYSSKFKAEFKRLRKKKVPDYKLIERLGITRDAVRRAKETFEVAPPLDVVDRVTADSPYKRINGLEYKIGLHGKPYYNDGYEWRKSSRTAEELKL